MVLDYLERQKDQPDPELLNEMNWNENDLRDFSDRWQQARELATAGDEAERLKWREKLKDLGLKPPTSGLPQVGSGLNDEFQQMLDSGGRTRPPKRLQKQWSAFLEALGRSEP